MKNALTGTIITAEAFAALEDAYTKASDAYDRPGVSYKGPERDAFQAARRAFNLYSCTAEEFDLIWG
jgi:hypothetical protein